jgi:hypothetical protein
MDEYEHAGYRKIGDGIYASPEGGIMGRRAVVSDAKTDADIALAAGLIGSGSNIQSANIRLYGSNAAAQGYVTGTGCDEKARGDARYAGLEYGANTISRVSKEMEAEIATAAERTRILAALQSLKPRIRPSHGDWARAWREEAALDMWNKVVALVAQEAPKGE